MPPYQERFPVGSHVRVASRTTLEDFRLTWEFHNPIAESQLTFAGRETRVLEVGFYHGGDPLYRLEDVPGTWHECCLDLPTTPVS